MNELEKAKALADLNKIHVIVGGLTMIYDARDFLTDHADTIRALCAPAEVTQPVVERWHNEKGEHVGSLITSKEPQPVSSKPVAWRVKNDADTWLYFDNDKHVDAWAATFDTAVESLYTHPDRTSEALLAASAMLDKIERVVGGTIINRETGESFTVVDLDVIRKAIHQHEAKP